jgi:hypothetical protein
MNSKSLFILLLSFAFAVIYSCSGTAKLKKQQKSFIPEVLPGIYIGMPLNDVKAARGMTNLSVVENDMLTRIKEDYSKDSISLIQYQFGKDKKLYELIIEYVPELDADSVFTAKYGAFNNGKEWIFTLNKKLKLKIWIYQNRLCIADSKHFKN